MSKLTLAVQTFLFTATAMVFTGQASQQAISPASEFDPALTGRVSMNGAIISSACDIDTGDGYQTIAMPVETRAHIKRTGEGELQDFSVRLTNCALDSYEQPTAWQYINIIFEGDEDEGMFRVNGSTSGVALELLSRSGTVIHPGKAMSWQQTSVKDNQLDYKIRLKNNMRSLVVGDYTAIIRYRIEYF